MKKTALLYLVLILLLIGCASGGEKIENTNTPVLTVSDGQTQKIYTATDLQTFAHAEASFKGVAYVGVPVTTLLEGSSFPLDTLKVVKAVASDGYTVNYDLAQIQKTDVIIAYAQVNGSLAEEDGAFRMVMPDEEGKSNVRMLVEIQVVSQ